MAYHRAGYTLIKRRSTTLRRDSSLITRDPSAFIERFRSEGNVDVAYRMVIAGSPRGMPREVEIAVAEVASKTSDDGEAYVLLYYLAPNRRLYPEITATLDVLLSRVCVTGRYAGRLIEEISASPANVEKLREADERWVSQRASF